MSADYFPFLLIVQARMGSKRFPGKSLFKFLERPSLLHQIDSLRRAVSLEQIIVATSTAKEDEVIAKLCENEKVKCFRGSQENVASRYFDICREYRPEYFIRASGDSPLIDHRIVTMAIEAFKGGTDMVTTVGGGFPSGMNIEAVRSTFYMAEYDKFYRRGHFEHVTQYFYEQPGKFSMTGLRADVAEPNHYKFSFDTKEDSERITRIFATMDKPHYEYTMQEKCQIYRELFLN